jgi:hypothetical protein
MAQRASVWTSERMASDASHESLHYITALLVRPSMAVATAWRRRRQRMVWRSFAERVDVGTELNVRLNDGRRMRATLVGVRADAVLSATKQNSHSRFPYRPCPTNASWA